MHVASGRVRRKTFSLRLRKHNLEDYATRMHNLEDYATKHNLEDYGTKMATCVIIDIPVLKRMEKIWQKTKAE